MSSNQYVSKYLTSNKMIHEVMNFVAISADKAVAVWENKNKWVEKKTVK